MIIKTEAYACDLCCGIFKQGDLHEFSDRCRDTHVHLCPVCLHKVVTTVTCWPADCKECDSNRNLRTGLGDKALCTQCGPVAL
jgi:hypothetical protein